MLEGDSTFSMPLSFHRLPTQISGISISPVKA